MTPEQKLIWVQIALTLLPLITACMYLFGMSWHMGYLSVFNVDSSEFPLSTEQTMLTGLIALASNLVPLLGYPIAAFAVFLFLWVFLALTFRLLKGLGSKIQHYSAQIGNSQLLQRILTWVFRYSIRHHEVDGWGRVFEKVGAWYFRFCYVLIVCSCIFALAYHSYRNGEEAGHGQIEKMSQGTFASANQLRYAKRPEGVSALRIICNSIECTFWTKADGTIFLRHDQIDSVVIPPESKKPASKK